jgi:hypothetical protein
MIKDFLPPPSELVLREDNVKVTLSLSRRSIDFFKSEAKKQRVPYQKMIRALVDGYAAQVENRSISLLLSESQTEKNHCHRNPNTD